MYVLPEALLKFRFLSHVNSLLTIGDRHWRKLAATLEKAESANSLPFAVHFHMGTYFCMGTYKCDVVVVIKMGAYIHGVLILCGCLLSRFYGIGRQQGGQGRAPNIFIVTSSNFQALQTFRNSAVGQTLQETKKFIPSVKDLSSPLSA